MKECKKKGKIDLLPYFLILPTFIGIGVFSFWPFIKTVICSFSVTDQFGDWIRWEGTYFWKELFTGEKGLFGTMMFNTIAFAIMNFVFTFTAGMILALLCVKKGKFRKVYQTIYALPIM